MRTGGQVCRTGGGASIKALRHDGAVNGVPTCAFLGHDAIGPRQQATSRSGDFASIGSQLQKASESLAEAVGVRTGERVLAVAVGDGHASPAGAGRLPFADGAFDVVLATFGALFTPGPHRTARELLRVTRRGGRIGLADWTPEGFPGQLLGVIAGFLTPRAGARSPLPWGSEPHVVELFGPHAAELRCVRRHFDLRGHPATHWLGIFRDLYGPAHAAFAALNATRQDELATAIEALLERRNSSSSDSPVVSCEYLEIVITKS